LDIGATKVYIEAEAPCVSYKKHSVVVAAVPWARHDSRFCANFEDQAALLWTHTSRTVIPELMRTQWSTMGDIYGCVYKNLEAVNLSHFDGRQEFSPRR